MALEVLCSSYGRVRGRTATFRDVGDAIQLVGTPPAMMLLSLLPTPTAAAALNCGVCLTRQAVLLSLLSQRTATPRYRGASQPAVLLRQLQPRLAFCSVPREDLLAIIIHTCFSARQQDGQLCGHDGFEQEQRHAGYLRISLVLLSLVHPTVPRPAARPVRVALTARCGHLRRKRWLICGACWRKMGQSCRRGSAAQPVGEHMYIQHTLVEVVVLLSM